MAELHLLHSWEAVTVLHLTRNYLEGHLALQLLQSLYSFSTWQNKQKAFKVFHFFDFNCAYWEDFSKPMIIFPCEFFQSSLHCSKWRTRATKSLDKCRETCGQWRQWFFLIDRGELETHPVTLDIKWMSHNL